MNTQHSQAAPVHATEPDDVVRMVARLDRPVYVILGENGLEVSTAIGAGDHVIASLAPLPPEAWGAKAFRSVHGVRYAYMAGGMANGISSVELVTAAARAGFMGSFGSGGLSPAKVDDALTRLAARIPGLPYAVNLLHTPQEQALEGSVVELCLRHRVRCVEASAYLELTPHLVRYRVSGLCRDREGRTRALNRVIAKASRPEVGRHFLLPPPEAMVADLLAHGLVTAEQAELARTVAMADDLTAEADSAGHTDRRPLSVLLPAFARLREEARRAHPHLAPVRLGAAGGIGTPDAVAAAFALGADYVVTGSINQACVEAGTALRTRQMLAAAEISDFDMAPSGYMFELGAQVQVLKKGTMFPQRARRLRHLYETYGGLHELRANDRAWLEKQVLRRPLEQVWDEVVRFFSDRDPAQVARAADDPKRQMALVFRWYLGLAPKWALAGDPDRVADYQIWAGPALGGFNDWARGSYLAAPENRTVADVAHQLLRGAALRSRINHLALAGIVLPTSSAHYRPVP